MEARTLGIAFHHHLVSANVLWQERRHCGSAEGRQILWIAGNELNGEIRHFVRGKLAVRHAAGWHVRILGIGLGVIVDVLHRKPRAGRQRNWLDEPIDLLPPEVPVADLEQASAQLRGGTTEVAKLWDEVPKLNKLMLEAGIPYFKLDLAAPQPVRAGGGNVP